MRHVLIALLLAPALCRADPRTLHLPDETATFRPGPGVEAAESQCAACHSADYIAIQPPHKGKPFWDAEVAKMVATYKAPIGAEAAKAIADYLAITY